MGFLSRNTEQAAPPPPPQEERDLPPMSGDYSEYGWADEPGMGAITEASETSSWDNRTSGYSDFKSEGGPPGNRDSQYTEGSYMDGESYYDDEGSYYDDEGTYYTDDQSYQDGSRPPSMYSEGEYSEYYDDESYYSGEGSRPPSMYSDASSQQGSRVPSMMSQSTQGSRVPSMMSQSTQGSRVPSMMSQSTQGSRVPSMMSQSTQGSRAPSMRSRGSRVSKRTSGRGSRMPSMMSQSTKGGSRVPSMMSQSTQGSRVPSMMSQSTQGSRVPSMMSQSTQGSRVPSMMSAAGQARPESMMSDASYMSEQSRYTMSSEARSQVPSMMSEGSQRPESMMSDASGWDDQSRYSVQSARAPSARSSRVSNRSRASASSRQSGRSRASKFRSQKPAVMNNPMGGEAIPEEGAWDGKSVATAATERESWRPDSYNPQQETSAGSAEEVSTGGHSRYRKDQNGRWIATQSTRMNFVPMFLKRQTVRFVPNMSRQGAADLGRGNITQTTIKPEYYDHDAAGNHEGSAGMPAPRSPAPSENVGHTSVSGHSRYKRGANGRWEATQSTRINFVPAMLKRFTIRLSRDNQNNTSGLGRSDYVQKHEDVASGYFGKGPAAAQPAA